jgi:hypothetical protein
MTCTGEHGSGINLTIQEINPILEEPVQCAWVLLLRSIIAPKLAAISVLVRSLMSSKQPVHECSCWRITEPLIDERLPDHVCLETMVGTIDAAERDGLLPPPADDRWPIRIGKRDLGFVIRQWAQEEPSQTLANLLTTLPAWRAQVRHTGNLLYNGALGDNIASDRVIARRLAEHGLPATPATVRHLRAVIAGEAEPLPARGLLVVTKVFLNLRRYPNQGTTFHIATPPHHVTITGDLDYATGPLLDCARAVALAHRDWLRSKRNHPLADIHEIRRWQKGAFTAQTTAGNERFDYTAEALRHADVLFLLAQHHYNGLEGALTEYLNKVYRKVKQRRARAGLLQPPPPHWRDVVKPILRAMYYAQR